MFDDLITQKKKKVSKKINLIRKPSIHEGLLIDIQDVLWDLSREPCFHCGRDTGEYHKEDCMFRHVMEEIDVILRTQKAKKQAKK